MVRKQLYLEESQDKALKQRARELGLSEAEVVRRALNDALTNDVDTRVRRGKQEILRAFFREADEIAKMQADRQAYEFDRQALYEEDPRFTRWNERE